MYNSSKETNIVGYTSEGIKVRKVMQLKNEFTLRCQRSLLMQIGPTKL